MTTKVDVPTDVAILAKAKWHWFETPQDVPWDDWESLPGGSAYLDRRYLSAMAGHDRPWQAKSSHVQPNMKPLFRG